MIEYNNYPEGARPRTLQVGEVVEYELVNIKKDVMDPNGVALAIPFVLGIPNSDVVSVVGKDGIPTYINIGFIKTYNADGTPVFGDIHFHRSDAGVIRVVGGKAMDQKKFEFMELCNWNADNPNRNTSEKAIFRPISKKKRAEERKIVRNLRKEAMKKVDGMGLTEISRIYIGMGHADITEEEHMRDIVETLAETDPEKFLIASENPDYAIMEVAVTAEKKGMLAVDYGKREVRSSTGQILLSWNEREDEKDWKEMFARFVKSDMGSAFYKELIDSMKTAKKVK